MTAPSVASIILVALEREAIGRLRNQMRKVTYSPEAPLRTLESQFRV